MMCVGWLTVSGHRVLYRFFIGVAATICCFALQVSAGETLRSFSPAAYVGWGMEVPDQYRADFILRELREFESRGEFPQLVFICQVDRAPEDALNRVLWRAQRGTDEPYPEWAVHPVADED
ncbi:MAG TPA: hypothetical protein PLF81_26490 [Candidatus Anammoximicrobium sp.]|nr:hypothetical protein [Candidatus Anammoximicrobium sp.]